MLLAVYLIKIKIVRGELASPFSTHYYEVPRFSKMVQNVIKAQHLIQRCTIAKYTNPSWKGSHLVDVVLGLRSGHF